MAITSFQTGTITLNAAAPNDLSDTATLGATVTQGNSILLASVRGGSNAVSQYNVTAVLSSDGTTVTAQRPTNGSEIIVDFMVVEASEFNVQHFEVTRASNGIVNQAITSVDTDYAFPICTGLRATGSSRSSDDFTSIEITTSTNVELYVASASSVTTAFQIVEMSSAEIASLQVVTTTLAAIQNNVTITSVDPDKSLIFASAGQAGGNVPNRQIPIFSLTSATNFRLEAATHANPSMTVIAYIVEFVNLGVTNTVTNGIVGTTTTEVLGGAPTYGGALINGLYIRCGTAPENDDDSLEILFTASLSGSTWTFERGASTTNANISYSVFDWADIFSSSGVTPVPPKLQGLNSQFATIIAHRLGGVLEQ